MLKNLPEWARRPIQNFAQNQTPPEAGAKKVALTEEDQFLAGSMTEMIAATMEHLDNTPADLDPRPGVVRESLGGAERVTYFERNGSSMEAVTIDEGNTASFVRSTPQASDLLIFGKDDSVQVVPVAIHIDLQDPSKSFSIE